MAHYAIVCPEDAGHLFPIGALGNELLRRGHRITIVAREAAAPLAEQLGLPLYKLAADEFQLGLADKLQWVAFAPLGMSWQVVMRYAFRWRAEFTLRCAPQAFRELKVDGVIIDQLVSAAGTVAEHAGIPFVTVCTTIPWNDDSTTPPHFTGWSHADSRGARLRNRLGQAAWHWYMGPVVAAINRCRRAWGLLPYARIDEAYSPLAQIAQLCPEFDLPRTSLPPVFHYVGSLATHRQVQHQQPFPWDRLDGRPLVFASLGTVPDAANLPVFRKIAAACAGLDTQLTMALGKWSGNDHSMRQQLGALPGDPLLVDFAPQLALLDKAALLITHAGANTVLEALYRGVPMVALPRSADQPGIAERVQHAGVGLRASFRHSTPEQLRRLIQRVLGEDAFRQRAKVLQHALLAAGGVKRAADIAEEAFNTRRPVKHQ